MLTIAYITHRSQPHINWFLDSLHRECAGDYGDIRIVVVDGHAREPNRIHWIMEQAHREAKDFLVVPPKPTVWQGKYRLTKRDYFAAANARNTALMLAPDGWIAYVDDLSVLMPGWLSAVREAVAHGYVCYGAYKKVLGLIVEDGVVKGYREYPAGVDSRWIWGKDGEPVRAEGSWMYGCSVVAPVEAFLEINGWDEDCDSLGGEDSMAGLMLGKRGHHFRYDRRMLTLESLEAHSSEELLLRIDKGMSPNDKSHAILAMTLAGRSVAPNYFGPQGIRPIREAVLAGEPFPITQIPDTDWFDRQPLKEM